MRWHGMLTSIARDRGYKLGRAAYKFKEKFGAFPGWRIPYQWSVHPAPVVGTYSTRKTATRYAPVVGT
jgi:hypothetical protein